VTWKRVKITGRVLMFRGLGRRIWKWRANRRLAKLVNAYIKTISERKESYKKQLNKLQELLEAKSIDELTYERLNQALEKDYIQKREEARMQLPSTQGANRLPVDADIQ